MAPEPFNCSQVIPTTRPGKTPARAVQLQRCDTLRHILEKIENLCYRKRCRTCVLTTRIGLVCGACGCESVSSVTFCPDYDSGSAPASPSSLSFSSGPWNHLLGVPPLCHPGHHGGSPGEAMHVPPERGHSSGPCRLSSSSWPTETCWGGP